jgi:hypothetical protein
MREESLWKDGDRARGEGSSVRGNADTRRCATNASLPECGENSSTNEFVSRQEPYRWIVRRCVRRKWTAFKHEYAMRLCVCV